MFKILIVMYQWYFNMPLKNLKLLVETRNNRKYVFIYPCLSSSLVYLSNQTCLWFYIYIYMLTWQELLQRVPSGNQFKLLLNNPKNVKDCGTITTKLLDNLIHRLSSILVSYFMVINIFMQCAATLYFKVERCLTQWIVSLIPLWLLHAQGQKEWHRVQVVD